MLITEFGRSIVDKIDFSEIDDAHCPEFRFEKYTELLVRLSDSSFKHKLTDLTHYNSPIFTLSRVKNYFSRNFSLVIMSGVSACDRTMGIAYVLDRQFPEYCEIGRNTDGVPRTELSVVISVGMLIIEEYRKEQK